MSSTEQRTIGVLIGLVLAIIGASILWGGGAGLLVGGIMFWKGSA